MIISGKTINLRTVELKDAEFICNMRQNEKKNRYLSKTSGNIEDQKKWISSYKKRESEGKEFYFVIESKTKEALGLVRAYDFKDNSFCWGSWLIKDGAPKTTAIESALQIYNFCFYTLNYENCHFDVRKGNDKVKSFHLRFGAEIVSENELDYFFNYKREDYETVKNKYQRFL